MFTKYFASALLVSLLLLAGQAQSNGVAFVTDIKGDAALDAGKATLMAEVKKGARISCTRECAVGVMYLISGKEYVLKGPGDFLVGDSEVTAKIGPHRQCATPTGRFLRKWSRRPRRPRARRFACATLEARKKPNPHRCSRSD